MCQKEPWGAIAAQAEVHSTWKANHRECTGLPCGSTGKRDNEEWGPRSILPVP